MTDADLDRVYTALCRTMTDVGEERTSLLLARFAMLAMIRIDDADAIERLIADARSGL